MKKIYGLFQTHTEYDTWDNIVKVSYNYNKLKKLVEDKNKEVEKISRKQIKESKKYIAKYPKTLETIIEEHKWFVKEIDII